MGEKNKEYNIRDLARHSSTKVGASGPAIPQSGTLGILNDRPVEVERHLSSAGNFYLRFTARLAHIALRKIWPHIVHK